MGRQLPRGPCPAVAPEGGPAGGPAQQWPLGVALPAFFSIISCPAAERSSPVWVQIWPQMGSEGRSQWADSIPLLCIGPRCPARPVTPFGQEVREHGSREEPLQPAQNCGACQRQTSSPFNKSERTFESFLKIYYAQGIKTQSLHALHFPVERCQGQDSMD